MRKRHLSAALAALLMTGLLAAPSFADAREADQTDNVKLIESFPYVNKGEGTDRFFMAGTDMAFSGKYVYAMQQGDDGGIHIVENKPSGPKHVNFFPCPGEQNDIAVVKPGLVAIAFHNTLCGGQGGGIRLVDVKNPMKPKLLGIVNDLPGGTHTLTVYPGEDIIYASPGGLPTNGGGTEQIIDVSNPSKPKVVGTFSPNPSGCHDVNFYVTKDEKLAVCVGAGEGQVWDVSDPTAPATIGHIPVPAQFPHSVEFTHDGKYMVIGDEAIAGNDCVGGPTGSIWIYDWMVRELPVLVGHIGPKRGPLPVGSSNYDRDTWCSAHLFNFVPGTYNLVASWYAGGMSVIDISNQQTPTEIAHYMGTGDDITNYWSAYWYDGRIWANDRGVGRLDVFEVKGLKEGHHH